MVGARCGDAQFINSIVPLTLGLLGFSGFNPTYREKSHYNFFSNLSSSVRQDLKTIPVTVPTGKTPYTAFLTADLSELDENSNIINPKIGIRQKSVVEGTIDKIRAITNLKTIIDSNLPIGHDSVAEGAIEKIRAIKMNPRSVVPEQLPFPHDR